MCCRVECVEVVLLAQAEAWSGGRIAELAAGSCGIQADC